MKVLLLADIPPCQNYTGGFVLDRLIRFLPKEDVAICSVVNPHLKPEIAPDLQAIPHLSLPKPIEFSRRILPRFRLIAGVSALFFEYLSALKVRWILLPKVIAYIKAHKIEAVWVVLEGQTIVRIAQGVTKALKIPVLTQVWDPFEWWLRDNRIDKFTQKRLLASFDNVMQRSQACATASWAMSLAYSKKYGVRNIPVIAGLPQAFLKPAATKPHQREKFIIAIAGQIYAREEWESFMKALSTVKWQVAGRQVHLQFIGNTSGLPAWPRVEYTGWVSQEEALELLAQADLLYMPYWFSDAFRLESSLSFPSKLVSYFSTGRPVFCHAPNYASPTQYLIEHEAGYVCSAMDSETILSCLTTVITDNASYAKFAFNGRQCFLRDFTLERMQQTFFDFLQLNTPPVQES